MGSTNAPAALVAATHATQAASLVVPTLIQYPAGALLRVKDICSGKGRPGLLPIVPRTWLKWVDAGRVPKGVLLGARTRVWPIEVVLDVRAALISGEQAA